MSKNIIIPWDLGATKCAAAVVEYDAATRNYQCLKQANIKLTETESLPHLIMRLEEQLDVKMADADVVCIGAAGVFDGDYLLLESGYPYPMHFSAAAEKCGWQKYTLIHDYAPIVCATFTDYVRLPGAIRWLNQAQGKPYGRRVALGLGSGLGLKDGVLFPDGRFWLGHNEMGHIGVILPPLTDLYHFRRHREFIKFLRLQGTLAPDEPLTFEKILSGKGTVRIHQFVHDFPQTHTPEEIGELMRAGEAEETRAIFAWYLGLFIGTVQLTFMPEGGIWMTGGVVLKHPDIFEHPDFTRGIYASPAYAEQRQNFPLAVMCDDRHAFYGAAFYAVRRLLMNK